MGLILPFPSQINRGTTHDQIQLGPHQVSTLYYYHEAHHKPSVRTEGSLKGAGSRETKAE